MRSLYKIALPVLAIGAAVTFFSCNKNAEDNSQYEDWRIRNYCEKLRPDVVCFQSDTMDIVVCCGEAGQHYEGEKRLLKEDKNIRYYRMYLKLLKTYTLE